MVNRNEYMAHHSSHLEGPMYLCTCMFGGSLSVMQLTGRSGLVSRTSISVGVMLFGECHVSDLSVNTSA
jgi:hypothetical protein